MTAGWAPLSTRVGLAEPQGLREGVPASLERPLREWISKAVWNRHDEVDRLMLRLNLVVSQERERLYQRKYAEYRAKLAAVRTSDSTSATSMPSAILAVTPPPRPEEAFLAYDTAVELLLDIIDGLLDLIPYKPAPSDPDPVVRFLKQAGRKFTRADPRKQLQQLLDDARSVYTIRDDGHGLERRISIAGAIAGIQAMASAEQAGQTVALQRLRSAWQHITAIHPNPSIAYVDAVRAVEAVACPLFLPLDQEPTLGKVRAHLTNSAARYELVISDRQGAPADVDSVISMMGVLWFGHRDRHEGGPTSAPISQEAAETAVIVASTLVQMLVTGAIRLKP